MATRKAEKPDTGAPSAPGGAGHAPVKIKKYANRRLYNTATSSYVTLDDLAEMVRDGTEFTVFDAKTGDDLTRSVLTQIIVEEEAKGQNLLPVSFLRQLIAYYGDSLQSLVPKYLEQSMDAFTSNQEEMRAHLANAFDGVFPFGSLEEMSRRNMELMHQAMQMFNPFPEAAGGTTAPEPPAGDAPAGPKGADRPNGSPAAAATALDALQDQIEALRKQVDALSGQNKK